MCFSLTLQPLKNENRQLQKVFTIFIVCSCFNGPLPKHLPLQFINKENGLHLNTDYAVQRDLHCQMRSVLFLSRLLHWGYLPRKYIHGVPHENNHNCWMSPHTTLGWKPTHLNTHRIHKPDEIKTQTTLLRLLQCCIVGKVLILNVISSGNIPCVFFLTAHCSILVNLILQWSEVRKGLWGCGYFK